VLVAWYQLKSQPWRKTTTIEHAQRAISAAAVHDPDGRRRLKICVSRRPGWSIASGESKSAQTSTIRGFAMENRPL